MMLSESDASQLTVLLKKKRTGQITEQELEKLISILSEVRKDKDLPVGIRATAGISLANAIKKQKPKELTA